ncbi:MAG: hypothetical protein ACKVT0_23125 [Planctomycetaceae bacterium]
MRKLDIAYCGVPLTCIGLLLFTGGDARIAGMIVLTSIACTAGIGLIVWFPILYIAGNLTLKLCTFCGLKIEDKLLEVDEVALHNVSNDVKALAKYIKKSQVDKVTDTAIDKLKQAGWSDIIINQALELAKA